MRDDRAIFLLPRDKLAIDPSRGTVGVNLRSGRPLWIEFGQKGAHFPSLSQDVSCRVVVLGGGVTGALVAYRLVKDGVATVLVDRREIGHGSTAASTGLLQYEIDTPLCELIKKVGQADAVHAYRRGLSAIDEIEELVSEVGDDCGFARRETLYFASAVVAPVAAAAGSGMPTAFRLRRRISVPPAVERGFFDSARPGPSARAATLRSIRSASPKR